MWEFLPHLVRVGLILLAWATAALLGFLKNRRDRKRKPQ
jgi:hypothetical protein